jgi:hypothetical protein
VTGEILDPGVLRTMSRPGKAHRRSHRQALKALRGFDANEGGAGWWIEVEVEVRLGPRLLVPDLSARITLLDKDNKMIHLGEDPAWRDSVLKDKMAMRKNPTGWVSGKFVHPHDACFDPSGNIFVAEWVDTGRISKLRKVS